MADEIDCALPENEMNEMCMESEEDHGDEGGHGHGNPMMANMKFLFSSFFPFVGAALNAFRYKAIDNYYNEIADVSYDDRYKLADQLRDYSRTAIFGTLFITQALSMAGIAVEVNMMLWHYLMMVWTLTTIIEIFIMYSAYEGAWTFYTADMVNNSDGLTSW